MWLTRIALRNPIFILMMSLMLVVLGLTSLRRLSVDLFPNINIPVIRVATFYGGAGPADIEKAITQPIERAVSAAPGVDRVESTSKQGVSIVSAWFGFDVNLDSAQFEVSQRVAQILNTLPPGIQQPFVLKFDITNIPVCQVAISADGLDERQLYDLAYNVIEPQLERLPGVASATVGGGKIREITVKADRDALVSRGLSLLDVVNAVRAQNLLLPSGSLRAGKRDFNVFANSQVENPRELKDVVLRPAQPGVQAATPVRISDVAQVEDGTADQHNIVRINGKRGVYLRVLKQPGANTISVVDGVRAALPVLRGVPQNVRMAISFDQSSYVRAAVKSLEHEALQGGALAVLVILLFLVSLRATLIVAVAIPLSVVATFTLLYLTGQTLNVFTLGGLALGVGRLVDDSIVELENIHRHLQGERRRKKAVLAAAAEVAMPILVSTITTIVVFIPVLFLSGVAKNLFVPLALTISFALFISFLVSRTVTPLLCLRLLPKGIHEPGRTAAAIIAGLDKLDGAYARSLAWVLSHKRKTVFVILVFFAGSLFIGKQIGTEFFPSSDESQFTLTYKTPIGTRVERTEEVATRLEGLLSKALLRDDQPLYTTFISDNGLPGGRTALFTSNTGPHAGNLQVNLLAKANRTQSDVALAERLRAAMGKDYPGILAYLFTGGIVKRILNFGSAAPIDVEILGYDLEDGAEYAKRLLPALRALTDRSGAPLLTDLQISREENYPELHVEVDRQKAGTLGITEQQVAQTLLTGLSGNTQFAPIPFTDKATGNEYFINVRLDDRFRQHIHDLDDLPLRTGTGVVVPLRTVAKVKRKSGPVLITRKYLQRIINITANVAPDKDLGSAAKAVENLLRDMPPPDGFSAQLGGQASAQREAFSGLGFATILAIALVYMVLASQFRSLRDPLVIMVSVPLGVSGVLIMLFLTSTTLSVNSFMGIIMMVGIVVSNGVLLLDYANVLRRRGCELVAATIEAARTRLRPILMTTLATVIGLFPMALGLGEGSETNMPLARAVIGGLTVSTFFTLFLVPVLYVALESASGSPKPDKTAGELGQKPASRAGVLAILLVGALGYSSPVAAEELQVLDFAEAIRLALARNPSVAVAEAEIERARGLLAQVRAASLPQLGVSLTYTRLDGDRVLGERVIAGADQITGNLSLQVPLVAPARWASWSHARDQVAVSLLSRKEVRRQVAALTAKAYLVVLAQNRLLQVSQRARDAAGTHTEFAKARRVGGVGNRLDEARATQEWRTTEVRVAEAQIALARAQEALGLLLGLSGPADARKEFEIIPMGNHPGKRSDVELEQQKAQATRALVRHSFTDYLPQILGTMTPFYQNPPSLVNPLWGWQAQLVLSLPIYDGGARYGAARERKALASAQDTRLAALLLQAKSEVRVATMALTKAEEAAGFAHQAAESARAVMQMATKAYEAGATTNLEVVDAARRLHDAEAGAAAAEDALRQARLELLLATGRFP